jgi:hypothetical protein
LIADDSSVTVPCAAAQGAIDRPRAEDVNNILTVLNTLLKKAIEWGVLARMQMHDPAAESDREHPRGSSTLRSTNALEIGLCDAKASCLNC